MKSLLALLLITAFWAEWPHDRSQVVSAAPVVRIPMGKESEAEPPTRPVPVVVTTRRASAPGMAPPPSPLPNPSEAPPSRYETIQRRQALELDGYLVKELKLTFEDL